MKKALSILIAISLAVNMTMPAFALEQSQAMSKNSAISPIPSENLIPNEDPTSEQENALDEEKSKNEETQENQKVTNEDLEQQSEQKEENQQPNEQAEEDEENQAPADTETTTDNIPAMELKQATAVETQETENQAKTQQYEYNKINRSEIKHINASTQKDPVSGNDGTGDYAFDGDMDTLWHSNYGHGGATQFPVTLEWSFGTTAKNVGKIVYYKRKSNTNGIWKKIDVSVKNGESDQWTTVLTDFQLNTDDSKTDITFDPRPITNIKISITETFDNAHVSAAEIQTFEAVPVDTVIPERQELRDKYADAQNIDFSIYSPESVAVLKTVLEEVKVALSSPNSTTESITELSQRLSNALSQLSPNVNEIAEGKPAPGTTQNNPFPVNIAGSKQVRIPALITLKSGKLAAAIDARWDHHGDHGNIDTLFSISEDNGKTWSYQLPNFFNDAVKEFQNNHSATFMDPVMIQGEDGTIYLLVDLFPGGTALHGAAPRHPSQDSGFVNIDGKQRMVLYNSRDGQTKDNYDYYVGDYVNSEILNKNLAPVIEKNDNSKTAQYYIDEHFYLYNTNQQPMYNKQLGSNKFVHQNVFFDKASIHVREATYLYLITSKDEGKTWSAPQILNPQVHPENTTFFGVGPGAGLSFVDGKGNNVILLPTYTNPDEHSSFIYSSDKGVTWKHSEKTTSDHSSESVIVQLDENTVRQFTRDNGYREIRYTDFEWNSETKEFTRIKTETIPGTEKTTGNQVSAIRYSKLVNGKPVILVSTATAPGRKRTRGKIYALTVEADKTMKMLGEPYQVNGLDDDYAYSSLTEMNDGNIALLYENPLTSNYAGPTSKGEVKFITIEKENLHITNDILSENNYVFDFNQYQTIDGSLAPVPTQSDIDNLNNNGKVYAQLDGNKVLYTALKSGTEKFTYQKNGKTFTLNFNIKENPNIKQEQLTMDVDETKSLISNTEVSFHSNPNSVEVTQTPIIADRDLGQTGNDVQYNGEKEALAGAVYTFKKVENKNGVFTMQATTKAGKTIYFAGRAANTAGMPYSYKPQEVTLEERGTNEFSLFQDIDAQGVQSNDKGYLWFWKNKADKLRFDRNSTYQPGNCDFELYHFSPKQKANGNELLEFNRINKISDIQDGEKYLIVAKVSEDEMYALRPSDDGNHYKHVLKFIGKGSQTVGYETTFKAVKSGNSVIIADDTAYHITVNNPAIVVPNTDALAKEFRISSQLDLNKYQDGAEKTSFIQTLDKAKQVLAQPENYTQQQVDDVKSELEKARLALVEIKPNPNPNPDNKPTQPETPNKNVTQSISPNTSDNFEIGMWLILVCVSGAGIVAWYINNKKQKE